jgi:thioesterase domain-containing protein/malonyl CoA-acyl carrier protein transacylase
VSAFGLGGTNAHVVLEEAPEREPSGPSRSHQILILSARTPRALDESTTRLAEHLRRDPGTSLADVAFTLQQGRAAFEHRRAVIGSDPGAASRDLLDHDPARVVSGRAEARAREVVFMFPGGGTQHADMGLELYLSEKIYQESLDRCAALFQDELSVDIRTLLFPKREAQGRSAEKLLRPSINLAVIFSTEVALANTLMAWGIRPAAVTGHSLGEYAAAYFAGVISLEDAVALIALRGRLYEELPSGAATLIVRLSEEEITARLGEDLSLAAVNSSDSCVISGVGRAIERLEADLRRDGCDVRRLPIAVAAHSSLINPIADRLTQRAAAMTLLSPRIPVISNVTGRWMSDADARDPSYWARHLRRPVRFGDGLSTLLANGDCALVEVGPGRTLSSLSRKHPGAGPARVISTTMAVSGSDRTEIETLLCAVAELWCAGVPVDWAAFSRGERRRRVPLPTYCFERAPHVVEAPAAARTSRAAASATPRSASSLPPPPLLKVPAIPHITMGTRSDRPAMAADEAETRADPVASTLASIWRKVLGVRAVRARDNFFDVGGNSLIAVQLRAHVQDLLNVNLPVHALVEHRTFGALTDRIRKELGAARPTQPPAQAQDGSATRAVRPGQLLVKLHEGAPGRSPLFLIQPIGGTVYTYYTLARSLPRSLPVYGIRASGMDPGEEVLADIAIMAERYLEEVRLIQPRGPYLLGGHSAGGVIAYEMAQQLLNRGQEVPLLLMIDSPSPSSAWRTSIKTAEDILQNMRELYDVSSHGYRSFVEALSKDGPFRTLVLHTWNALGAYTPRPTRAGVVYIRAEEQPDAEQADALRHWMDLARGPFSCHKVAGNHFTVMEAPGADLVARMVSQHTALYGEAIGFDAGAPSSRPGRAAEGRTTVPPPSSSGVVYSAKRDLL